MAELRMNPDELVAGATGFAGHVDMLTTHVTTINIVASGVTTAFGGFDAALAPIVTGLGRLGDGVGALTQQVQALGTSLGGIGTQAPELDQRGGQAITRAAQS